jgi:hypothetical protein
LDSMDRRRFLTFAGLAAGLGATGRTLVHAQSRDLVKEARERARTQAKPLLIAWIPEKPEAATRRGLLWAQWLRCGSDEDVAVLALCVVVFARPGSDELQIAETQAATIHFEAGSESVGVPLPDMERVRPFGPMGQAHSELALAIRTALVPDEKAVLRLRDWNRAKQKAFDPIRTVEFDAIGPHVKLRPRISTIDHFAAQFWHRKSQTERGDRYFTPLLARAALARLFDVDPPGARWQVDLGDHCPPCGMATIPSTSRLFLEYYTQ